MKYNVISASILSAVLMVPAAGFAQSVFDDANRAEDRVADLMTAIEDDAEREVAAFGNEGRPQGFNGSIALRGIASTGTTDSVDVGIGADFDYVQGANGYALALSYAYGADGGVKNEESLIYGAEYTRDFSNDFFGFAKLQGSVDSFSTISSDTFLGFGLGYRVLNDATSQWSIQAGPGYRYTDIAAIAAADVSEGAVALSSDYATKLNNGWALTNDTDVIWSESDTAVINDFAVSMAMSDALALRTSVVTEYHSSPAGGSATTDNTLGVSLVYSLN